MAQSQLLTMVCDIGGQSVRQGVDNTIKETNAGQKEKRMETAFIKY